MTNALNSLSQRTPNVAYVFWDIILVEAQNNTDSHSLPFHSLWSFLITSRRKPYFEVAIFNSIFIHTHLHFNKERAALGTERSAGNNIYLEFNKILIILLGKIFNTIFIGIIPVVTINL